MPKPTFHKLSAEKRARFIDAAIDEFAAHPYDQASISRVVARLEIAKGSVYQYFDNKQELFLYLVDEGARRKRAALGVIPAGLDFWDRLAALYCAGLDFQAAEPRWARLLERAAEPSLDPALTALAADQRAAGHAFLEAELRRGQACGALRPEIDPALTAHLVHGLLSEGLLRAYSSLSGDRALDPGSPAGRRAALVVIEAALSLLRRGLGSAPDPEPAQQRA